MNFDMGISLLFNDGWEFTKQAVGSNLQDFIKKDEVWQAVDLPHDWMIYDTKYFYESCEGWYKKRFDLSKASLQSRLKDAQNTGYKLRFEGIYMDSTIWVNGIQVGEWKYGYSTFEVDITDALIPGVNEVIVRAVLQMPNSRWYSGAGIYRNVWLKAEPDLHFASDGIYISTAKIGSEWTVSVHSEIACLDEHPDGCIIRNTIMDSKNNVISAIEGASTAQELKVTSPILWSLDNPTLYTMKTELIRDGEVIDEEHNRFGFRTIRFDTEQGFFLNESHVKLQGVCEHHDLGALGAAVNRAALKRQLMILKEMGVNAIRTSHNMCAVELIELADEMGILIDNEAFDMWERPKTRYDYARFFNDWVDKDVASWVRRDRNHPCVIMWSIGNEVYDTHAGERGQEVMQLLMDLVDKHDPKHNAYVTFGSNYMPWENTQKCADIIKLAGYNYAEKYYEEHHELHKDWMIYGSETGSVVQSRGIYHFPLNQGILSDDDEQCSSLGNSITSWGARSIEKCITDDRDAKFSAGMFIWSGFDYIGEPTPYHTKNSYFGQIDTAGFKKDAFYVYQAEWTDYKLSPMVHVFPYWDFNDGQLIDVCICSNAPKVELFVNGVSQGRRLIDHINGKELVAKWQIPYKKGGLRAVAYDENNIIIAEDIQKSFSDAAQVKLVPDKYELTADGQDMIFIEISMQDKDGNPVHNANNRVYVNVTGAARLVGLDNGNSTDYESYKGTSRRLFSGKLLAMLAAKTTPGDIHIEVTSEGLPTAAMTLIAKESIIQEGISAQEENIKSGYLAEIPVRKLGIISKQGTELNDKICEAELELVLYPENATYSDITWRVANASGVDSNIAQLEADGRHARVKALGDGTFYVRASINNGGKNINLISLLDFKVSGMGEAYLNPFSFVSGSLYTRSIGEAGNGNDRGVATARDGETVVIYDNIDFGDYGSDIITIPIFELGGAPTPIQIWEGVPGTDGSKLIGDVIYHKKSIWNTYQEESYKLNKRLTGITAISFLLRSKVHIKGFSFTKLIKAYEQLSALSKSSIYGDTFRLEEDSIEGIGNNVTIAFEDMDFTKGLSRLIICGRSPIDKNTIHVRFNGADGEIKQLVEFKHSDEYVEREFALDNVTGIQTVSFIFLPGCDFDFKWFRFIE
jgi:beta-galactosidase